MSTGYKLMIAFFVLGYLAGIFFLPGLGALKYSGFLPLGIGVCMAVSDKENFNPEGGRFWVGTFLMFAGALIPLIMWVVFKDSQL